MEIEKKKLFLFSGVSTPTPGFAHNCSFTLQTSYKTDMLGPGGGEAVKMLKKFYNASPSNQLTSIILFRTVACLYTFLFSLTSLSRLFQLI